MIDYYAELFGKKNIEICLYPEQFLKPQISSIDIFSETLGYNFNSFYVEKKNISLSSSSLKLMKSVNEYLSYNNRRELRNILQSSYFIDNNKFPLFDLDLRKEINEYYTKSNEELYIKYLQDKKRNRNYFKFNNDFEECDSEPNEMINVKTILYLYDLEKRIEHQATLLKKQQKVIEKLSQKRILSKKISLFKNKLKKFFSFKSIL